jgi:hypothetical protein
MITARFSAGTTDVNMISSDEGDILKCAKLVINANYYNTVIISSSLEQAKYFLARSLGLAERQCW